MPYGSHAIHYLAHTWCMIDPSDKIHVAFEHSCPAELPAGIEYEVQWLHNLMVYLIAGFVDRARTVNRFYGIERWDKLCTKSDWYDGKLDSSYIDYKSLRQFKKWQKRYLQETVEEILTHY